MEVSGSPDRHSVSLGASIIPQTDKYWAYIFQHRRPQMELAAGRQLHAKVVVDEDKLSLFVRIRRIASYLWGSEDLVDTFNKAAATATQHLTLSNDLLNDMEVMEETYPEFALSGNANVETIGEHGQAISIRLKELTGSLSTIHRLQKEVGSQAVHNLAYLERELKSRIDLLTGVQEIYRQGHFGAFSTDLMRQVAERPNQAGELFIRGINQTLARSARGEVEPIEILNLVRILDRTQLCEALTTQGYPLERARQLTGQIHANLARTPRIAEAKKALSSIYDPLMETTLHPEVLAERREVLEKMAHTTPISSLGMRRYQLERRFCMLSELAYNRENPKVALSGGHLSPTNEKETGLVFRAQPELAQEWLGESLNKTLVASLKNTMRARGKSADPRELYHLYNDILETEFALLTALSKQPLSPQRQTQIKVRLARLHALGSRTAFQSMTHTAEALKVFDSHEAFGRPRVRDANIRLLLEGLAEGRERALVGVLFDTVNNIKIRAHHLEAIARHEKSNHEMLPAQQRFWCKLYDSQIQGTLSPEQLEKFIREAAQLRLEGGPIFEALKTESLKTHYSEAIALAYVLSGSKLSDFLVHLKEQHRIFPKDSEGNRDASKDKGMIEWVVMLRLKSAQKNCWFENSKVDAIDTTYKVLMHQASRFLPAFPTFLSIEPEVWGTKRVKQQAGEAIAKSKKESRALKDIASFELTRRLSEATGPERANLVAQILIDYAVRLEVEATLRQEALLNLDPVIIDQALHFAQLTLKQKADVKAKIVGPLKEIRGRLEASGRPSAPAIGSDRLEELRQESTDRVLLQSEQSVTDEWIDTELKFRDHLQKLVTLGQNPQLPATLQMLVSRGGHSLSLPQVSRALDMAVQLAQAVKPFQDEVATIQALPAGHAKTAALLELIDSPVFADYALGLTRYTRDLDQMMPVIQQADTCLDDLKPSDIQGIKDPLQKQHRQALYDARRIGERLQLSDLFIMGMQRIGRHDMLAGNFLSHPIDSSLDQALTQTAKHRTERAAKMANEGVGLAVVLSSHS